MEKLEKILNEAEKVVLDLKAAERAGWKINSYMSRLNDKEKIDDLTAREIYSKTFPSGAHYHIQVDRIKVERKQDRTTLPDLYEHYQDTTTYYRITARETMCDEILSSTTQNIIANNPYLEATKSVLMAINILESGWDKKLNINKKKDRSK